YIYIYISLPCLVSLFLVSLVCLGLYSNGPKKCCFKFYPRRIPAGRIIKYEVTRSDCPKAGVIFTTWKSRKLCAHKNQSWVQRAMNEIDQRPFKGTNVLPGRKTEADTHPDSTTMKPHTSTALPGHNTEARVRKFTVKKLHLKFFSLM
uniref:C-C motif chemokine n=1 Tax=Astyanax mexicanus TaxID=7994 RepID=A0A8B9GQP3_ASTMX